MGSRDLAGLLDRVFDMAIDFIWLCDCIKPVMSKWEEDRAIYLAGKLDKEVKGIEDVLGGLGGMDKPKFIERVKRMVEAIEEYLSEEV